MNPNSLNDLGLVAFTVNIAGACGGIGVSLYFHSL